MLICPSEYLAGMIAITHKPKSFTVSVKEVKHNYFIIAFRFETHCGHVIEDELGWMGTFETAFKVISGGIKNELRRLHEQRNKTRGTPSEGGA